MNEVQKYLRYSIPGMVFILQLLIMLSISNFFYMKGMYINLTNFGSIIGFLLISTTLGYIFSIIYFALRWRRFFPNINHEIVAKIILDNIVDKIADYDITKLTKKKSCYDITKLSKKKSCYDITKLSKKKSWEITSLLYISHIEISKQMKGTKYLFDRMVDAQNSLGATFYGSILSIAIWAILYFCILCQNCRSIDITDSWIMSICLLLPGLIICNYISTISSLENMSNQFHLEYLRSRKETTNLFGGESPV